ncbi:hypothetical protein [Mycolicibacterium sp. CBMA 361]|uniref:hypothetical protein n=1 Tax=Mycolicibacterium sp. CBMA 361 TaxID=2606610 RepID=UPI0012DC5793|nr:hypothetical protein [Mycolicibacterium sp. CBMA 361]MUM32860.1 hypothetical protein [Mycolicibacterium sp. CBMA 361]
MARKEIDPIRAKSALAVAKEHPGMLLFLASPGVLVIGIVWWLIGPGWALLLLVALLIGGA